MRHIDRIILHCSATPAGRDYTVDDITRWHRQRGFRTIGYHWVVYRDGTIHPGRPEREVGAHCKGYNAHSIGVCYIGGLTPLPNTSRQLAHRHVTLVGGVPHAGADTRTPAQRQAMRQLIATLLQRYPGAQVCGHYQFANKACPCFKVPDEL